jgi:predicted DNA-binding protein
MKRIAVIGATILEYLQDLVDLYIARKRLADFRTGRSRVLLLEQVERDLGLDD